MSEPVYYTREMVLAMPDDGNRYETVHGELLVTPAPRLWHQMVVQRLTQTHGRYARKVALGLGLRMDWGPQYTAHQFQGELRCLGIRASLSYVGEPECNGIMERWIRTLKEECLYLHDFETLQEARDVIGAFIERYNREWLLARHGHRIAAAVRQALAREAA